MQEIEHTIESRDMLDQGSNLRTQLAEIRPRAVDTYTDFDEFTQRQGGLRGLGPKAARILGHRKACCAALLAALCFHVERQMDKVGT
jgi:hypothetical protein